MVTTRWAGLGALLAAAALTLSACSSSGSGSGGSPTSDANSSATKADSSMLGAKHPATGSPVKIGLFNVEGGTVVSLPDIGNSAVAAADYANDYLGGLAGHKIQIDRCGDKADGASATACANKFVQDKVAAVVAAQPATADQLVPIIKGAGIPYFGSNPAASTELSDPMAYFDSSGFVGFLAASAVYAKQHHYKTAIMIGPQNPMSTSGVNAIGIPLFKQQGVQLKGVVIPSASADATSQITSGLVGHPDAAFMSLNAALCQSVLSALQTAGSTIPRISTSACVDKKVFTALGGSGVNGLVILDKGNNTGSDQHEAKLYSAVMATYQPKADPSGLTSTGYMSMLGFVRAVNAGGLKGAPTPAAVNTAIKSAKNVPLPLGDGKTFSCDAQSLPAAQIKATICNSQYFVTTYTTLNAALAYRH